MEANDVIGKWAVEKGLLDCWHRVDISTMDAVGKCNCVCGDEWRVCCNFTNPDYSIYENIAPVLDKIKEEGFRIEVFTDGDINIWKGYMWEHRSSERFDVNFSDLPPTLRDMVAELISKGEV